MSSTRPFKNAAYTHLAQVGKALSSPVRLEILDLLAQAPRTVEVLATAIHQSVANTSHHLQRLRQARLVAREQEGVHVVYSLADADVARLLGQLQSVATQHVAELEKLTRETFDPRDGLEAIDRETLMERLVADEVVLVDVRPEQEFAAGHVPGALSLPLDQLASHLETLPKSRTIVAYCRGPFCTWSADAVRELRALGFDAYRTDASVHDLRVAS